MNKYNKGQAFRKAIGKPCSYCARVMNLIDPGLLPTRDHVHPRFLGGQCAAEYGRLVDRHLTIK